MKQLFLSAAFAVAASGAHASSLSIDFETGYSGDVTVLSSGSTIAPGVTVKSDEKIQVVQVGPNSNNKADGFVPLDTPAGGGAPFGRYFLSGDFKKDTALDLHFATDVTGLSFEIADIDGSGKNVTDSTEFFSFIASLNGVEVDKKLVNATEVNGDAQIVKIMFGEDIRLDKLAIAGVTKGGKRNIGWGIDNIHATPVPLPAAGWLLVGAFGGLAAMKRRRKTA